MAGQTTVKKAVKPRKLWRESVKIPAEIETFCAGSDPSVDQVLLPYDCQASIAHVEMLARMNLLTAQEKYQLVRELERILTESRDGKFTIRAEEEDSHTAIENQLVLKLGKTGEKIHTLRSRNDQVLTALYLYYKDRLSDCECQIFALLDRLYDFRQRHRDIAIPGFTHTRKAVPTTIGIWTDAFISAMRDNLMVLENSYDLIDQSPLGTGAGYGLPMTPDRHYTADRLGFKRILHNPIHAQNSRGKYTAIILHTLSLVSRDLNRLASDLIFFTLPEFAFFTLPAEFFTGSSIMPHKKNPDVLELLRARHHRLVAWEAEIKNLDSNLISGYHRDVQLTKEPAVSAFCLIKACLSMATLIFQHLQVDEARCRQALSQELYATETVYRLVSTGMPFRQAYHTVARTYTENFSPEPAKNRNPVKRPVVQANSLIKVQRRGKII